MHQLSAQITSSNYGPSIITGPPAAMLMCYRTITDIFDAVANWNGKAHGQWVIQFHLVVNVSGHFCHLYSGPTVMQSTTKQAIHGSRRMSPVRWSAHALRIEYCTIVVFRNRLHCTAESKMAIGYAKRNLHAVIIPYPAQGHVTPCLQLAKKLVALHGFRITFVNTTHIHDRFMKLNGPAAAGDDQ